MHEEMIEEAAARSLAEDDLTPAQRYGLILHRDIMVALMRALDKPDYREEWLLAVLDSVARFSLIGSIPPEPLIGAFLKIRENIREKD